jgi:hypothetical protein
MEPSSSRTAANPLHGAAAQPPLADRLPLRVLLPYLLVASVLALCYGSSFLLADALHAAGIEPFRAGTVVGLGTLATLAGALFAGRWAERLGLLPLIACAALVMACAMACFALTGYGGLPLACAGGLLLGLGWAVFYMLAPIQIIVSLEPAARLEAFTLLSGSQMLGMGLAAPFGHWLARQFAGMAGVFAVFGALCLSAAACALLVRQRLGGQARLPDRAMALSWPAAAAVLRSRARLPVVLMGICACTFAGLSTFQSLYAHSRGLSPDIFFVTFTATTVVLRFTVAPWIGRLPLGRLALCLLLLTLCGIALLIGNTASAWLYGLASFLFATGYGLTYSTLNAMAVNLAQADHIPAPMASQVFTLGYFAGAFGFPYAAGSLIASSGIQAALFTMLGLMGLALAVAGGSPVFRARRMPP